MDPFVKHTKLLDELQGHISDLFDDGKVTKTLSSLISDIGYIGAELSDNLAERDIEISNLTDDLDSYEAILSDLLTIVKVPNYFAPGLNTWCLNNLSGDYYRLTDNRMGFVSKNEAVLFKLAWGRD